MVDRADYRKRTAVITGGAGLLGVEFCHTLTEAGAAVVVADLNATAGAALASIRQMITPDELRGRMTS